MIIVAKITMMVIDGSYRASFFSCNTTYFMKDCIYYDAPLKKMIIKQYTIMSYIITHSK